MAVPELPPAIEARLRRLPRELREHVDRTRDVARDLAQRHGIDAARVDLAAAAHDLARALSAGALLAEARRYELEVLPIVRRNTVLLHGPLAAVWLEREDGVRDEGVLEAVRCHTTGKSGMGPVAKAVFLADKLDPRKAERYPYMERLAVLAGEDLDCALLMFLNEELARLVRNELLIHPASLELRNDLMMALRDRG